LPEPPPSFNPNDDGIESLLTARLANLGGRSFIDIQLASGDDSGGGSGKPRGRLGAGLAALGELLGVAGDTTEELIFKILYQVTTKAAKEALQRGAEGALSGLISQIAQGNTDPASVAKAMAINAVVSAAFPTSGASNPFFAKAMVSGVANGVNQLAQHPGSFDFESLAWAMVTRDVMGRVGAKLPDKGIGFATVKGIVSGGVGDIIKRLQYGG
jgi:hypothetical protein